MSKVYFFDASSNGYVKWMHKKVYFGIRLAYTYKVYVLHTGGQTWCVLSLSKINVGYMSVQRIRGVKLCDLPDVQLSQLIR